MQPPSKRACFSSITKISFSLHESVQRPWQIVLTMVVMPPPSISGVKASATHAGAPMQFAMLLSLAVMLNSSQRVVRRPAQIMLMFFAGETITLKVNWWATHSGGPMHFARLPFPLAGSVTQAWQPAEAVSGIVLASKSCGHSVAGVKTGLSSREDLASRAYSGERGPAAHSHTEPHRRSRTAMLAFDRTQCRTSNR